MKNPLPVFTIAELEQSSLVEFPKFENDDAVTLGTIGAEIIRERDLDLAVDVIIGDDLVFRAKLGNTGPGNDEWLAGKAAVTRLYGEPSLLVRLRLEASGTKFDDLDVDHARLRAHGGSIPIRVGGEIVGTITMSGEPDVVDHDVAAEAIRRFLAPHDGIR